MQRLLIQKKKEKRTAQTNRFHQLRQIHGFLPDPELSWNKQESGEISLGFCGNWLTFN